MNCQYETTINYNELMIDTSLVQTLQSSALIQVNFTIGKLQQISVNYIICDSSFWLDIQHNLVDLSA